MTMFFLKYFCDLAYFGTWTQRVHYVEKKGDGRAGFVCWVALLCIVAVTDASDAFAGAGPAEGPSQVMPPPPDPDRAVAAEYALVKDRGTVEAYKLFIERHPRHPLANEARRALSCLEDSSADPECADLRMP